MKQILTILLLFATTTLMAQTLYTRKDTIAITQDSVTLHTGQFRGKVQWQHSLNGQQWNNLANKTDSLLKVAKSAEGYYRAQITDGTCLPTYSDTAVVVITKTKNEMVTSTDNISGATFIDRDDSVFTYIGTPGAAIPINTVLVDDKLESDIRVVTEVAQNGDTIKVKTEPGTMEDLFVNQEFKLSTATMTTTKSAYLSTTTLAKAMKDGKGVIHPVEVIDNNAPASKLKSAQSINESLPGVYFRNDFSGDTIWNEGGATITFDQAYYQLGAELNYEFKFEQQDFDWRSLQFPKGKLTKFKICTDKEASGIESKMIIKATTSHEFKKEETKVIRKDVFNKTFKYLVFVPPSPIPIPFWATVKVDLMRGSSSNISGEASVSGGATGNFNLELGASYENGTWTTIKPALTPKFTLEGPDVDAKVNVQAKVEVYPHIEVAFYSALAPYLDIAPYVREEMEYSLRGNYKYDLYTGVNARLGIKAEVLGEKLFDYKTEDLKLYEKSLYTAPQKVQLVSGANQKGTAGKPLPNPIVIKVLDSKDKPVKNAVVNFKASMGKLFKALQNAELKSALLFASADDSTELALASDTTGQVSINWKIADATAKQNIETYLMNGKDSIRKDTRDTITAETCGCDESKFDSFTDSRDGHKYKTIKIGNQIWMAENLAYLPYSTSTDLWSKTTPCYYIYNDASFSILYNWPAAVNACPSGWHLPGDAEWTIFENYLSENGFTYEGTAFDEKFGVATNKLAKSIASVSGWYSNEYSGSPGNDSESNNSSCFSASGRGYLQVNTTNEAYTTGCMYGKAVYPGKTLIDGENCEAEWWSKNAGWCAIGYSNSGIFRIASGNPSERGESIRCIKD